MKARVLFPNTFVLGSPAASGRGSEGPGNRGRDLAAGAPVVASDRYGTAEILERGRSGLLFPTSNATAFGNVVLHILNEPALGGRLAEEGRRRLRSAFTSTRYARDVEAIYSSLS
jgi:glycosyltransferase involved in cell wall biosynthesis